MLEWFLVFLSVFTSCVLLLDIYRTNKLIKEIDESIYKQSRELNDLFINGEKSNASVEDMLRMYENERDREFNEKIENLKLELYGTTADVLHPDLVNIPHEEYDSEIIKTQKAVEEYAE